LKYSSRLLLSQAENHELRDKVRRLEKTIEEEKSFQFMHGVYWNVSTVLTVDEDEEGNRIKADHWDGPFCPLCKDMNGKAVRLKNTGQTSRRGAYVVWECEVHHTDYEAPPMDS
jgi:hypothetical protein